MNAEVTRAVHKTLNQKLNARLGPKWVRVSGPSRHVEGSMQLVGVLHDLGYAHCTASDTWIHHLVDVRIRKYGRDYVDGLVRGYLARRRLTQ